MISNSVLVLAAHPDDEALGCGGTIAKLTKNGASVKVAFLADGVNSRGDASGQALAQRRESARSACTILGAEAVWFGDLPDNRLDNVPLLDVVRVVESLVATYRPDTILTHHVGDLNVDHRRVCEAVVVACRPQAGHPVRTLLCFEVPSSTEWQLSGAAPAFQPNWIVDISETLELKMKALGAYEAEMRTWPHPRSLEGVRYLAHWRGATIGVSAAEAFSVGRIIS